MRLYRASRPPSPVPRCRWYPTCSSYALEALERHGALKGSYLAVRRLGRCHPLTPGGIDKVPDAFSLRAAPRDELTRKAGSHA